MDNIIHTNYSVRCDNDKIVIDYKKTSRDWFHFIFNALIGTLLICFPAYLFHSSKHFSWTTNAILVASFFALLIIWGLFKLIMASEIIILPTKSLVTIDKHAKTVTVKRSFFRTSLFTFDSIKLIQLSGHDTVVKDYHEGQTFKRRVYFHQLKFLMQDGEIKKVHKFLPCKILIPILQKKETYDVNSISKQIAKLIASETGIKYVWLGTKNTADT